MAAFISKRHTRLIQRNRHRGLKENRTLDSHNLDAYWTKGSVCGNWLSQLQDKCNHWLISTGNDTNCFLAKICNHMESKFSCDLRTVGNVTLLWRIEPCCQINVVESIYAYTYIHIYKHTHISQAMWHFVIINPPETKTLCRKPHKHPKIFTI